MYTAAMPVITRNGMRGVITPDAWQTGAPQGAILVRFEDDSEYVVPIGMLEPRPDGGYWVNLTPPKQHTHTSEPPALQGSDLSSTEEIVIPILQEEAEVRIERTPIATVRVQKTVEHREETVQTATVSEHVAVERLPLNQVVAEPPAVRHEGDTMIIPVIEERLVVQKQYLLVEEIRITTTRHTQQSEQPYTLRRETVSVERLPITSEPTSETTTINTTQQGETS